MRWASRNGLDLGLLRRDPEPDPEDDPGAGRLPRGHKSGPLGCHGHCRWKRSLPTWARWKGYGRGVVKPAQAARGIETDRQS